MPPTTQLSRQTFATAELWRAWLHEHHATSPGLWVQLAKKSSGISSVQYPEVLDIALCYGWIDGQRDKLDGDYYLQKFTPRRARSIWSKVNREKVLALIERGEMQPAGLAAIEAARADGRWEAAYDSARHAVVPPELAAALAQNPGAAAFFETLARRNRYAILFRLATARQPATRARRLATILQMLNERKTFHP